LTPKPVPPRGPVTPADFKNLYKTNPEVLEQVEGGTTDLSVEFSEDYLGLKFAALHSDTWRYVAKVQKWRAWTGQVWKDDETLRAFDLSRAICRKAAIAAKEPNAKRRLSEVGTFSAVERAARADRLLAATVEQFDSDTMQFNTASGTLDLVSGKLMAHNPANFHTKIAGCGFSDTRPELWLSFLDRITDHDKELQDYLRRVCGYCLSGLTVEQSLFFLYGVGANGKSVFVSTISGILGDYGKATPVEVFLETKSDQHPTGLAGLQGARLAFTTETERNSRWAESRIKWMTGGERLTARLMRQDYSEFDPQFKVMVSGNHCPRLSSVGEAVRRRVHLIPFRVVIPAEERDQRLTEKLRKEWPSILGWMLSGCMDWQKSGLHVPQAVKDATDDYLNGEDKTGLWLDERCDVDRNSSAGATAAWHDYKQWCEELNEQPGSQRTFSQELHSRGFIKTHTRTGNSFQGLCLKSDMPEVSR